MDRPPLCPRGEGGSCSRGPFIDVGASVHGGRSRATAPTRNAELADDGASSGWLVEEVVGLDPVTGQDRGIRRGKNWYQMKRAGLKL
jgi:hypothetical protein